MIRAVVQRLNLSTLLPLRCRPRHISEDILTDADIWARLPRPRRNCVIARWRLQVFVGFRPCAVINAVRTPRFWTNIILMPMMRVASVVGNLWTLLFSSMASYKLPGSLSPVCTSSFSMTGEVALAP